MDGSTGATFAWQILNEQTHLGISNRRAVVALFTVPASTVDGTEWLEFTWLPTDEPRFVDVLFGLSPGAGDLWNTRWASARKSAGG